MTEVKPSLIVDDSISDSLQLEDWWKAFVAYHQRLKAVSWKVWKISWKKSWPETLFDGFWDHIKKNANLVFFIEMEEYRAEERSRSQRKNQKELVRIYKKYVKEDDQIDIKEETRTAFKEFVKGDTQTKWFMLHDTDNLMDTFTVPSDECPTGGHVFKESCWDTAFKEIKTKLKTSWTTFQEKDIFKDAIIAQKENICVEFIHFTPCENVISPFRSILTFPMWWKEFTERDHTWAKDLCELVKWLARKGDTLENFDFLFAMEEYKKAPTQEKLVGIYDQFVVDGAPREINIPYMTRSDVAAMATGSKDGWFKDITPKDKLKWDAVERSVQKVIRQDVWVRFKDSEEFGKFIFINREELCNSGSFSAVSGCAPATAAHFGYHNPLRQRNALNGIHSRSLSFGDSAHYHHERADHAGSHPYVDYEAVYSHPSALVSDNSGDHFDEYLVGGVFGGVAIVFILMVFCIGLAFGMVTWWTYRQRKVLYSKANDEENEPHL